MDLNEQVCQKLISESKLKEHIDEKRAMAYLRLIQNMFRSYYLTVSSDSSLPDLVSGYERQLSQVLDMMIYGILEEDSSKKEKNNVENWEMVVTNCGYFAVFAGFNMLAHPATTLASMTFLFALVFAVQGISEIVQYFKSEEKHSWNLFGGIVTLILALTLFSGSFIDMVTFVPFIISFWALTMVLQKLSLVSRFVRRINQ